MKRCFPKFRSRINDYKFKYNDFYAETVNSSTNNITNVNLNEKNKMMYKQPIRSLNFSQSVESVSENAEDKLLSLDKSFENDRNSIVNENCDSDNDCDNGGLIILRDSRSPFASSSLHCEKELGYRKKSTSSNASILSQSNERSVTPYFVGNIFIKNFKTKYK